MNDAPAAKDGISRRKLLVGGGAGVGLLVAWGLWPRRYAPNMRAADGEHVFGPWLKIAEDGKVIVAIPQSESGQGVYTALAQIVAGELGADWRSVAVQPVSASPIFANTLLARAWAPAFLSENIAIDADIGPVARSISEIARRNMFVVTGGSSSIRQFERPCREAGAAARTLLCQAAAARWGIAWEQCETERGFVIAGQRRLSFAELVVEASALDLPSPIPLNPSARNRLSGRDAPRLDLSAKVDGSVSFAGDVRLPDMVFASVRAGPAGNTRLLSADEKAGLNIRGVLQVVKTENWVAAVASNWWAANNALDAMAPVFRTKGRMADSTEIGQSLSDAIAKGPGFRATTFGDIDSAMAPETGARIFKADYTVGAAVHAPIETRSATADFRDGRLQLWFATQAPQAARIAAAKAIGISVDDVVHHPMMAGGSFDRNFDNSIAAQVAVIAKAVGRPVQLTWSRPEDFLRDHVRSPALGRLSAAINAKGAVTGLTVRVAAASTMRELANRIDGQSTDEARKAASGQYDVLALEGAQIPYAIPNVTIDHFPVSMPMPTGPWRGLANSYNCFFIEGFIDELAHKAGLEPLSFRMQMLAGQPRLAQCLTGVANMVGSNGGVLGSGRGIACHSMRGSHIAVIVTASNSETGVRVDSIHAMADCGRLINPDLARQQIEGGIVFGLAQALGSATDFESGLPTARRLRDIDLPKLADVPEITVELARNDEAPGGVSELGVPAVAPAIANAIFSAAGIRLRELPLLSRGL
ncbi:xanthine dehydrogenase family protein molybdopterin-binding subunit [Sphingorhabdus wooponensis]|uniref:Xanthine dehydrogenase family protein molybdopterin-binding subunit n=1 Tax=Sphingorhabdus wooponensis TaxID=940136 RepID=A0A426RRU6_9SPHN|nr:molybdopterin cofactor-binding domain-containing protein [Sphingorhabdus wooponensis]RRQ51745.1 xanthine dehydrogenase family protein molybdopterin-binding subunit [Sphingorhabdus wooponensis]